MREILFRGKTDNVEWVHGHYTETLRYNNLHWIWDGKHHKPIDPETLGQYTGLTDKNGTKIFEGDVVQVVYDTRRYGTYVVAMSEERGGWFPFACGDGCGCCECDVERPKHCEIIGNIHDNPELIEVQDNG